MGYGGGYCGDGYCDDRTLCDAISDWFHAPRVFSCCGRGYAAVDAVMLTRGDCDPLPLARLNGAAGPILLDAEDPYHHLETLPRVTLGYVMHNDTAVEATYFYKDDMDASASALVVLPNFLIVPDPTATIFNPSTFVHVNQALSIQSAELNLVETGRTFNFIAGFRWIEIQDRMIVKGHVLGINTFTLDTDTYNTLFGGQGGMRTGFDCGLFHFEFQGKAGMYFNDGNASTRYSEIGVAGIQTTAGDGECESFVGELSGMMSYRVSAKCTLRAGYQVYWICNTATAVGQINPLDPTNSGGILFFNDRNDLTLHGPSAGIDVRF
jgi:hypothetical protein